MRRYAVIVSHADPEDPYIVAFTTAFIIRAEDEKKAKDSALEKLEQAGHKEDPILSVYPWGGFADL